MALLSPPPLAPLADLLKLGVLMQFDVHLCWCCKYCWVVHRGGREGGLD